MTNPDTALRALLDTAGWPVAEAARVSFTGDDTLYPCRVQAGVATGVALAAAGLALPGPARHLRIDLDQAAGGRIKQVEAAKESALAGAGRTDDRYHLALADLDVDVLQHLQIAEGLGELFYPNHAIAPMRRFRFGSVLRSTQLRNWMRT